MYYLINKLSKFYIFHICFLILQIPLSYSYFLKEGKEAIFSFIINIFLLQSWFPNKKIWLGFNGVSWYLSTLIFLIAITPLLYLFSNYIKNKKKAIRLYISLVVLNTFIIFILSYFIKINVQYWLYAFPPVRFLDYSIGFYIGKIFKDKKDRILILNKVWYSINEIFALLFIIISLILSKYINESFRRVVFHLPFALYTIYIFAQNKGIISKLLSCDKIVQMGNKTFYYFIAHVVYLRYLYNVLELLPIQMEVWNTYLGWIPVLFCLVTLIFTEPVFTSFLKNFY